MKQFNELKAKHQEAILLFKIGDFYEAYDEDATKVGKILGVTVTRKLNSKERGSDGHALRIAGFPHHALGIYARKLIKAGERVAVCDPNKVTEEYPSDEEEAKPETDETKVQEETKPSEDIETLKAQHKEETKDLCEEVTNLRLKVALLKGQVSDALYYTIKETIKILENNLPSALEEYYCNILGKLEVIRIKNNLDFSLTKDEINYLFSEALKSQNK